MSIKSKLFKFDSAGLGMWGVLVTAVLNIVTNSIYLMAHAGKQMESSTSSDVATWLYAAFMIWCHFVVIRSAPSKLRMMWLGAVSGIFVAVGIHAMQTPAYNVAPITPYVMGVVTLFWLIISTMIVRFYLVAPKRSAKEHS